MAGILCSCGVMDCKHALKTECDDCFKKRVSGEEKTPFHYHRQRMCCSCGAEIRNYGHTLVDGGLARRAP